MSDSDDMPVVFEEDKPFARQLKRYVAQAAGDGSGTAVDEIVANHLHDTELSEGSVDEVQVSDSDDEYVPSAGDDSSDEDLVVSTPRKRRRLSQAPRKYVRCASESSRASNAETATSATLDIAVEVNIKKELNPEGKSEPSSTNSGALAITSTTVESASISSPVQAGTPVVRLAQRSVKGRNGYMWRTNPIGRQSVYRSVRNVVDVKPGPTLPVSFSASPENYFKLLMSDDIIETIVQHTNDILTILRENVRRKHQATFQNTDVLEMQGLIGVLLLQGVKHENHLATVEIFDVELGAPAYRAAMSERRFCFLLRCLRFGNSQTCALREAEDKFATVREIWDPFIKNCQDVYWPGEHITVDEQLLGFRGRCGFTMHIPNKPAKYGIKIIMVCDSRSKFMLNAIPYLGKYTKRVADADDVRQHEGDFDAASAAVQSKPLAQYVTEKLVKRYRGSGKNVTAGNWFTSVALVKSLRENYGLTYVGAVRKNKREIPYEMLDKKNFFLGQSAFAFSTDMTLVTFASNTSKAQKKLLHLVSSMHDQPVIRDNGKPEIITFYNSTKSGVDTFDQMCSLQSCTRMTNRWSITVFYGMLNAAAVNAFVLYHEHKPQNTLKRRLYQKALAMNMIKALAQRRLFNSTLPRGLRFTIRSTFPDLTSTTPAEITRMLPKRKSCHTCRSPRRKRTRYQCRKCGAPVCINHFRVFCKDC